MMLAKMWAQCEPENSIANFRPENTTQKLAHEALIKIGER